MGEGFKKQKRKFRRSAFIYSAICGVSFGLFAMGIVYLALALAGAPLFLEQIIGILTGVFVGATGLGFGAFLPLLLPSDQKIAATLDQEYGLHEKVQTALAYQKQEGPVVAMLQADTDERLLHLPKRKFEFRKVWQYFVIGILSVAVFASSLFVPYKLAQGEDDGPTLNPSARFEFTPEHLKSMQELIANVEKSPLEANIKEGTVGSLNALISSLALAETNGEMMDCVEGTAQEITNIIKSPLTYRAIANALGTVALNGLAKMIADGVQVYHDFVIVNYEGVEAFDAQKAALVTEAITEALNEFFSVLEEGGAADSGAQEGEGDEAPAPGIVERTYGNIYLALTSAAVQEDDALRSALYTFAERMAQNDNRLNNDIEMQFEDDFKASLADQSYRLAMNKYVTNRIREIFGLKIPADEEFVPTYADDSSGGKNDGQTSGGYGPGDLLYGSDDLVYDPVSGKYVTYGELFNDYYAIVESMLREGNLTEEQKEIIRSYIDILLSGIKAEE